MTGEPLFLGIDVGTGSARAGMFTRQGLLVGSAKAPIERFHEPGEIVEQSSNDIWVAICSCVREAIAVSGVTPSQIAGIGFDATCSLVVVGKNGDPLPVSNASFPERNIIVWMDHRAVDQAKRINALGHDVLRYVGNRISPEMQTPKLLWLKENRPEVFAQAEQFFDLADYLTWRATGSTSRSICTTTCKWTYLAHEQRWDETYFRQIGLADLADEGFTRIGTTILDSGTPLGSGLTTQAAADFGLPVGTPVAASLIDAHAGGIGTIGADGGTLSGSVTSRLAFVFGTSACTMTSTEEPAFIAGVWGPYYSAMIPGLWLNEAGQSAAGAAIDHLIACHPASHDAAKLAYKAGMGLPAWLAFEASSVVTSLSEVATFADGLHVVPEFLGNRAPIADPDARAIIVGLDMDRSIQSLVRLYIAGICGLGYGLRQIIDAQRNEGVDVDTIVVSGGAAQSELVRQLIADATGVTVAAPVTDEPVLLGSAMLAGVAAGHFPNLNAAMVSMSAMGKIYAPVQTSIRNWHVERYEAFKLLQATGRSLRNSEK
jgi:D-ribulokinase